MNAEIKLVWWVVGVIFGVMLSIIAFYGWIHTPKADSQPIAKQDIDFKQATKRTADQSISA